MTAAIATTTDRRPAHSGHATAYGLSSVARTRLENQLMDLRTERAIRATEATERSGDVADIAELAARDMLLEQLDLRIARIRDALAAGESAPQRRRRSGTATAETVRPGMRVAIRFEQAPQVEHFIVGDPAERDADCEVITPNSPLGQALLGAHSGDTVSYAAPVGTLQATLVELDPAA